MREPEKSSIADRKYVSSNPHFSTRQGSCCILKGATMSTIAPIRQAFVPYRRDEIIALAHQTREQFGAYSLDEIAERLGILFLRRPDPNATKAGFSCIMKHRRRKHIPSVARPGKYIFSFHECEEIFDQVIVINPFRASHEREVFWHEYYHLYYSPSRGGGMDYLGGFSTSGVLDKQEEWRANLFAAVILIPTLKADDTPIKLAAEFGVSTAIANIRMMHQTRIYPKQ